MHTKPLVRICWWRTAKVRHRDDCCHASGPAVEAKSAQPFYNRESFITHLEFSTDTEILDSQVYIQFVSLSQYLL